MLKEHKEKQDEMGNFFGDDWKHKDMVFTSPTGNFYDRTTLNGRFKRFLKKHAMPSITLHGLRHSNASLLISNGVGIKEVSNHLGHCNIAITGDIYLHMFEESKAKIASIIGKNLL